MFYHSITLSSNYLTVAVLQLGPGYWSRLSRSPVEFRNCVSSCLPDVWRHIRGSFFDGQHHYGDNDCDSDAGEDSQSAGSDQLVRILQKTTARISRAVRLFFSWLTCFIHSRQQCEAPVTCWCLVVRQAVFAFSIKHISSWWQCNYLCGCFIINRSTGQIQIHDNASIKIFYSKL